MTVSRSHLTGYSTTVYLRDFMTFCATTTKNKLLREMAIKLGRSSRKGHSEYTPMTVTAAKAVWLPVDLCLFYLMTSYCIMLKFPVIFISTFKSTFSCPPIYDL